MGFVESRPLVASGLPALLALSAVIGLVVVQVAFEFFGG
jgi:hypothetical protein